MNEYFLKYDTKYLEYLLPYKTINTYNVVAKSDKKYVII